MRRAVTFSILAVATPLAAQIPEGQYLATVQVQPFGPAFGEMYLVDLTTRMAQPLVIPNALRTGVPSCVTMLGPRLGWVGTTGVKGQTPGDVFRIVLRGGVVTAAKVNTAPNPGDLVSQIARLGSQLYYVTRDASGTRGFLLEVPSSGGAPVALVNFSKVSGFTGEVRGVTTDTKRVYCGEYPSGRVWAYDLRSRVTRLLTTLPAYLTREFHPVKLQMKGDPATSTTLVALGSFRSVAYVDVNSGAILQHYLPVRQTVIVPLFVGFTENHDTGDWALGTWGGEIDVLVPVGRDGQVAPRVVTGIGSSWRSIENTVTGLAHHPSRSTFRSFGTGCGDRFGFVPTSIGRGALGPGRSYVFGIEHGTKGGSFALAVLGTTDQAPYPIDLTRSGAPGCLLRTDPFLTVVVPTAGNSFAGSGSGSLPVFLPNVPLADVFLQWVLLNPAANALGVTLSDARVLRL